VTYILNTLKLRLFRWLNQRVSPEQVLTFSELYAQTLELRRPEPKASRIKARLNPKPRRQYK